MAEQADREKAHQILQVMAATAAENAGHFEEAITRYHNIIAASPTNGMLRYSLGQLYMRRARIKDAITELKESLKIAPEHGDSYSALATCYSVMAWVPLEALCHRAFLDFQRDGDKAATTIARLRELDAVGAVLPAKEFLDVARQQFVETVKDVVKKSLGGPLDKLKPETRTSLEKYVSTTLTKRWAFPHFAIASDLSEKRKNWAALAHFVFGLQQSPESQGAIMMLALCYADLQQYDQALRVMELVDVEKAEPEEQKTIRDQKAYLTGHIKNRKR